jgi:choloylglycine hydrolase
MQRFKVFTSAVLLALFFFTFSGIASACTTFFLNKNDELIFGKNYDFEVGYGMVIINKKNIDKYSQTSSSDKLKWTSRYGSVTFNQYGKEFPSGGINEAGLVIELMWLEGTQYPEADERYALGTLQWIQYQLDNHASIKEVIESDSKIRISNTAVPLHYLVTDREGRTVTIEFLDGKLVYHEGRNLPYPSLTNHSYSDAVNYIKQFEGFGGSAPVRGTQSSLDRFVNICKYVKEYDPQEDGRAVDYGFSALDKVAQGEYTRWNIVYDIKNMTVYFRTQENRKIKNIDLRTVDFSCDTPAQILNIDADAEGSVTGKMSDYSQKANKELIYRSYNEVSFLQAIPKQLVDEIAEFPEGMVCRDKSEVKGSSFKNDFSGNTPETGGISMLFVYIALSLAAACAGVFIMRNKKRSIRRAVN